MGPTADSDAKLQTQKRICKTKRTRALLIVSYCYPVRDRCGPSGPKHVAGPGVERREGPQAAAGKLVTSESPVTGFAARGVGTEKAKAPRVVGTWGLSVLPVARQPLVSG